MMNGQFSGDGAFCLGTLAAQNNIRFQVREAITEHAHYAFSDNSEIDYAQAALQGHASYNCGVNIKSTQDSDHHNSFQDAASYTGAGGLGRYSGFWSLPSHTGTGTIDDLAAFRAHNPLGSGHINVLYGLYVANLSRGDANWAVYASGDTPSYFGGDVTAGSIKPTKTGAFLSHIAGTTSAKYMDLWNTGSTLQFGVAGETSNIYTGGSSYAAFMAQASARPLEFATNGVLRLRVNADGTISILNLAGIGGPKAVMVDDNGLLMRA